MYTDPSISSGISKLKTLNQPLSGRPSLDRFSTNVGNKFTTFKNALSGIGGGALKGIGSGLAMANPATAAITGGLALTKLIAGKIKQNKADAMMPRYEDPEERALASYAARRKRAFQTGTASSAQRNALASAMKTGINKSFQVGGGAKGLNMMTQLFNQAQLGVQDRDMAGELQYAQMEKDAKTRLSQRKLELGLLKYNTEQARAAQLLKEGKSMAGATLARTLGLPEMNPYGTGGEYPNDGITAKNTDLNE